MGERERDRERLWRVLVVFVRSRVSRPPPSDHQVASILYIKRKKEREKPFYSIETRKKTKAMLVMQF